MLKKFLYLFMFTIPLMFINVKAITTDLAKENIVLSKTGSLIINYQYDDYDFTGISVKVYKIASFNNEMMYDLTDTFSSYPIKVNGIKTNQEWNMLKDTLKSYIQADLIKENYLGNVNNNTFSLSNLELGLYLVETEKILKDDYTLAFDSFLINIPNLDENGYWEYEVEVYPKVSEYVEKMEIVNYKVLKQWKDNGKNRPDSVTIEIYKNSQLVETKILSSDNNWLYEWEVLDAGSEWSVVERNVEEGYKVSVLIDNNTFIVVNDLYYDEENPKTIDNINIFFYLLIISVVCLIFIIIYLYRRKKNR